MGRLNKRKEQLKRLAEAKQILRDKDESGCEEEVTVFDDETTVGVDALGEDAVWQEGELEFEDVEDPGKDEAEQAQGRLEELRAQAESKRPARYVGNSEPTKRRRLQKQRPAAVGTMKLTSFFPPVINGDSGNEDDEQQDTDEYISEDEEETTLNGAWKDSQRLTGAITLLEQKRQKAAQKNESAVQSLRRSAVLAYLRLVKNREKRQSASVMTATASTANARTVKKQSAINAFLRSGSIPVSQRGKHNKLGCFLRDEDVRDKIDTYLLENKFDVRIHTLKKYINEEVLPDLDDGLSMKLSERTIIRRMKIFGHSYREATNGVYMDGHERDDFVAYRRQFLEKMTEHEKRMPTITDDCSDVIWSNLQNEEKPLIFVTHDESVFHAFDGQESSGFQQASRLCGEKRSSGSPCEQFSRCCLWTSHAGGR